MLNWGGTSIHILTLIIHEVIVLAFLLPFVKLVGAMPVPLVVVLSGARKLHIWIICLASAIVGVRRIILPLIVIVHELALGHGPTVVILIVT